ncbi:MAG: substrate-binding domain-containing protein [Synergistaceae bacterium]|jgi:ribose transport system substrate-binding protein|nr:substrate-binding domain-containing protein [Synergistaceae bacterium]
MRKFLSLRGAFLILILSVILTACDPGYAAPYKIGVLGRYVTHGWVAGITYHAEQRCRELEKEGRIEYKIYASGSGDQMSRQFEALLAWGAQAVVVCEEYREMDEPVREALKKGVVMIIFDVEYNIDGVRTVTGDNEDMGVQSAKYILEKVGPEATVVMLEVPSSGIISELRKKGFVETVAQLAPNLKIITFQTEFTRGDGLKDFSDILAKVPKIDAVFSIDDETSIGVLAAIREAKRGDVKVVTGGGGCQEYFRMMENEDIWIQSTLYSPVMVIDAVDMAVDILDGKQVEPLKRIPTKVVDRENYREFLDPASPY